MGYSRGGLTTKIHMLCDTLGMPVKFILTSGECSDFKQAIPLLKDEEADYALADKGYDGNQVIEFIENNMNAVAVIPPRSNRLIKKRL